MGSKTFALQSGSIMPRVTTGNTMATCVVIGERARRSLAERAQVRDIVGVAFCSMN